MPDKLRSLHYDSSLPPFLAKLRGQQAEDAYAAPDPMLAAHRRTGKKRTASEEAEDAPLVVDEQGNVVALKDGLPGGDGDAEAGQDDNGAAKGEAKDGDAEVEKEKVAGIGAAKKRKTGKVIGGGDEDENNDSAVARAVKQANALAGKSSKREEKKDDAKDAKPAKDKAPKKKAKKVKLSFGDDDAD